MSSYLRPCVAMGVPGPTNGGFYGPWSVWAWDNPSYFTRARTPWVRIWASWKYLQPLQGWTDPATDTTPLENTRYPWAGYTPQLYLYGVDGQITEARKNGQRIILTLWEAPYWANSPWQDYGTQPLGRPFEWAPPWDVSTQSAWAYIVYLLALRYNKTAPNVGNRWVDFLEIANEPNQQWWPQVADKLDGQRHLHKWTGRMLHTARQMTRSTNNEPLILGPAVSDADATLYDDLGKAQTTPFSQFMPGVVDEMRLVDQQAGVRTDDAYVAWSHHNYYDVKFELTGDSNRARRARDILASKGWNG